MLKKYVSSSLLAPLWSTTIILHAMEF